jgi:hypothetical protein
MQQPVSSEKDEVILRSKFQYKDAFFYMGKALRSQNISDVLWVETNIEKIHNMSAS